MGFAREMVLVAVGWQVYGISRNPLHLGLVGLAEFLPLPLLALPAGAIADRLSRKLVFIASLAFDAAITALLIVVSLSGAEHALAVPRALVRERRRGGARQSRPHARCRRRSSRASLLTSALAIRSTVGQATVVTGPALGGLLFSNQPGARLRDRRRALPRGDRRRSRRSGRGRSSRSRSSSPAPGSAALLAGPALRPPNAGPARRDLARPRRRPLRRRRRAAAALRPRHPRGRAGRARDPPQRAGGGRAGRRDHAHAPAARRARRAGSS